VLVALSIDADSADEHDVLGHVQPVDLNDEQIELGNVAAKPLVVTAYSGADVIDLAALLADYALRSAPAVTAPIWAPSMPSTA
jgi:hypothetical protein